MTLRLPASFHRWTASVMMLAGLMFVGLVMMSQSTVAAELIMYEQDGCFACEQWKKQVGKVYHLTDEAKIVPLRRVDIHGPQPKDLEFLARTRFTPMFVVIDKGRKIGEIFGYNDEAAFYGLLGELIEKAQYPTLFITPTLSTVSEECLV
jgi:thioredoxin-related protein